MNKPKPRTKVKERSVEHKSKSLNQMPQSEETNLAAQEKTEKECNHQESDVYSKLFDQWNEKEFVPQDSQTAVYVNSLESEVGYSSLVRQLQHSYTEMVAYHRSSAGGSLSIEEARKEAFYKCVDDDQAKEIFNRVMSRSLESIYFGELSSLYDHAPRVAEHLWEHIKQEGRKEFESGHLAANSMLPVNYMRDAWSVARYLGIRESFVDEWNPQGGIELSLIDMLAQSFFQWQYWIEEIMKRSQTRAREEHPEYVEWQRHRKQSPEKSWNDGFWLPPTVSEQDAIEDAVQMADRWNRIYMRTLRQLRDWRRYTPQVTINNPNQVNIAANGGQQINLDNTAGLNNTKK